MAEALIGTGWAALARAELDEAAVALDAGLELATSVGEPYTQALALAWLGEVARLGGDGRQAQARFEQCRRMAGSMATPYPLARSLIGLGRLALDQGDAGAARALVSEAIDTISGAGLTPLVAFALEAMAQVDLAEGHPQAAERFEAAMEAAGAFGDKATTARSLWGLGSTARAAGELEGARRLHHQGLALHQQIGDRGGALAGLEAMAGLAMAQGHPAVAARVLAATEALRQSLGYQRTRRAQQAHEIELAAWDRP